MSQGKKNRDKKKEKSCALIVKYRTKEVYKTDV